MKNKIIIELEKQIIEKQDVVNTNLKSIDEYNKNINRLMSDNKANNLGIEKLQYVLKIVVDIENQLQPKEELKEVTQLELVKFNRDEILEIIPTKECNDSFEYQKIEGYEIAMPTDDNLIIKVGVSKYRTTRALLLSLPDEINKNTLGDNWSAQAVAAVRTIKAWVKRNQTE